MGASVAAIVASLGLLVVPASAARPVMSWNGVDSQFDNEPGSGRNSWAYVRSNVNWPAWLNIQFYDGTYAYIHVWGPADAGAQYDKDIFLVQMCRADQTHQQVCDNWRNR